MQYTYAEIDRETNTVRCTGVAPFIPDFGQAVIYAVDITDMNPMPTGGWLYDPETGAFTEPDPENEHETEQLDPYLGELILDEADGAELSADGRELNAIKGQRVTVTGRITRDGETLTHIAPNVPLSMPILRLPLIPTDIDGNAIPSAQPSMAVANITEGIVIAQWEPEYTGMFKVTERGINVRLPDGQKLRFAGLDVFVLPSVAENE